VDLKAIRAGNAGVIAERARKLVGIVTSARAGK
jgi:hypothetical protein